MKRLRTTIEGYKQGHVSNLCEAIQETKFARYRLYFFSTNMATRDATQQTTSYLLGLPPQEIMILSFSISYHKGRTRPQKWGEHLSRNSARETLECSLTQSAKVTLFTAPFSQGFEGSSFALVCKIDCLNPYPMICRFNIIHSVGIIKTFFLWWPTILNEKHSKFIIPYQQTSLICIFKFIDQTQNVLDFRLLNFLKSLRSLRLLPTCGLFTSTSNRLE